MWYKQLSAFWLPFPPTTPMLEDALFNESHTPPADFEWFSEGFAAPQPFSSNFVFETDGKLGFALKREEKVLPSAVIREQVQKRVEKIARPVGRKEKQELKEKITDELLPKALTRSSRTNAVIAGNWLLTDTVSLPKMEKLIVRLRGALGGLEGKLLRTKETPQSLMTRWLLAGEAESGFALDDNAVLVGNGNNASRIKIDRSDLTREDIIQHVKNGLKVCEMGLIWRERITFTLTADLKLKRIRYLDTLTETYDNHADDAASLAFATQIIMSNSLTAILDELIEILGGFAD